MGQDYSFLGPTFSFKHIDITYTYDLCDFPVVYSQRKCKLEHTITHISLYQLYP